VVRELQAQLAESQSFTGPVVAVEGAITPLVPPEAQEPELAAVTRTLARTRPTRAVAVADEVSSLLVHPRVPQA
jgi:hypothetical protein